MSIKSQLSGKGGIYAIVNNVTGKFYIGKTKDFYKRYTIYSSAFRKGANPGNKALVKDVIKYGRENFAFRILEVLTFDELKDPHYLSVLEEMYLNCVHFSVYNYTHRRYLKKKGIQFKLNSETGFYSWSIENLRE
ncbi:MAG: GIY-YIG nuclease family protein [Actinomycetota bacterium]